jgi:hypothetical protein
MPKGRKPKPLRDIDSVSVSLFVKGLGWAVLFLCPLGFIYGKVLGGSDGAVIGVVTGLAASGFASLLTLLITDTFGGGAAFLFRGRKANWNLREQLEGDINQVRLCKMNRHFDQALLKVEEVLSRAPDYPVALYLKAAILWEGFDEPIEAKRYLDRVEKATEKTDPYQIWATSLHAAIVQEEKKRLNGKRNDAAKVPG